MLLDCQHGKEHVLLQATNTANDYDLNEQYDRKVLTKSLLYD
jgi:hypothetical protein